MLVLCMMHEMYDGPGLSWYMLSDSQMGFSRSSYMMNISLRIQWCVLTTAGRHLSYMNWKLLWIWGMHLIFFYRWYLCAHYNLFLNINYKFYSCNHIFSHEYLWNGPLRLNICWCACVWVMHEMYDSPSQYWRC